MKKIVVIKSEILQELLVSFLISTTLLLIVVHLGKFSYTYYNTGDANTTTLQIISYKTSLGSEVTKKGYNYTLASVLYGEFDKKYNHRIKYYAIAALKELPYAIILTALIFLCFFLFRKFSFNINSDENVTKLLREDKSKINLKNSEQYLQLKRLLKSQIITKTEFEEKVQTLKEKRFAKEFESNPDFLELKKLYEQGLFDDNSFNQKTELLKEKIRLSSVKKEEIKEVKDKKTTKKRKEENRNITYFYIIVIIALFASYITLGIYEQAIYPIDNIALLYLIVTFLLFITITFSLISKKFFAAYLFLFVPLITAGFYIFGN